VVRAHKPVRISVCVRVCVRACVCVHVRTRVSYAWGRAVFEHCVGVWRRDGIALVYVCARMSMFVIV